MNGHEQDITGQIDPSILTESPSRQALPGQETSSDELIAAIIHERRARNQRHIERALSLERELGASVVGVWGRLVGSGVREYAVYRQNDEDSFFVVLGRDPQAGVLRIRLIDPSNTPNQGPIRSLEEFLAS